MGAALKHRGPDGEGLYCGPGIGLVARRLMIGLRAASPQPLVDGNVALVLDGQIYNAPELRRELERRGHRFQTDAELEVAIQLYRERGPDFLHALRGMFALALWDGEQRTLLLARDRLGIKALQFAATPDGLVFASEAKGLIAAGWVRAALDPEAVDHLLRFSAVHAPRTAFAGVRALLPGQRLFYREGKVRTERWWDLGQAPAVDRPRSESDWAEGLRERLEAAVRIQLRSSAPLARIPRWLRAAPLIGPLSPRRRPYGSAVLLAPAGPPLARYEAITGLRSGATRSRLYTPDFRERVRAARREGWGLEDALPAHPPGLTFNPVEYVHVKLHLPDFTQLKVDRTAMACGIEVRFPFLDHEVVEYAARIPARHKLGARLRKNVLRRAMRGVLPDAIRLREKRGLAAPFSRWMSQPLPEFAGALLSDAALREKGYFDPQEVSVRLARHRAGLEAAGEELMGVLTVQLWDELFLAGRGDPSI
jgi:asparagine synthetase B (glutamine-hydrolysing)